MSGRIALDHERLGEVWQGKYQHGHDGGFQSVEHSCGLGCPGNPSLRRWVVSGAAMTS
jgi:hypothetical protein